jgi:hypothetical protein
MTLDEFWDHIRATRRVDPDAHAERLEKRLTKLKPEEILDFVHWWDTMMREAYQWDLWGAAYLINGGASDDGFHYFCNWLILQGRDVFQKAVTNPDTLADVVDPDEEVEWDGNIGWNAWFTATKTKQNDSGYAALDAAERSRHGEPKPMPELGDNWDFDDDAEMRKRLPRLSALYIDGDEEE